MAPKTAESFGLQEVEVDFGMLPTIIICVVGPYKHVREYAKNRFGHELVDPVLPSERNTNALCIVEPEEPPIIWLPKLPTTAKEIGDVVHEVYHAVGHIFDHFGIPVEVSPACRGEVFAYALGHGVTGILQGLDRARRTIRRKARP